MNYYDVRLRVVDVDEVRAVTVRQPAVHAMDALMMASINAGTVYPCARIEPMGIDPVEPSDVEADVAFAVGKAKARRPAKDAGEPTPPR